MRFSKLAFIGSQLVSRRYGKNPNMLANNVWQQSQACPAANGALCSASLMMSPTRLFSTTQGERPTLQNINKEAMEEIIEDYEEGGREESGYVVLDVREPHEIEYTGKLSENTITFPLQKLAQYNAFALEEDDFEEIFGFEKPRLDETLVFSCAAGIRSVHAAQFAAQSGYTKLVNYMGGAHEWFY